MGVCLTQTPSLATLNRYSSQAQLSSNDVANAQRIIKLLVDAMPAPPPVRAAPPTPPTISSPAFHTVPSKPSTAAGGPKPSAAEKKADADVDAAALESK